MAHIRIPVDSHQQLIVNTIETLQDNVSLALGCIQAQLWVQYMTAAITWEGEDGTLPAEIPAEYSLPLKGGMPQWAPSPPHLQHSEMPHRSQRPIVAEAQCPAALLQCSSFTGAVKRGCTLGSGSVTAALQGLAVPSLFLAHWWKSHAHQVLAPWISQHPQTARVGPCSPLHPAELGRWVPAPATSQGVTRVPWPR